MNVGLLFAVVVEMRLRGLLSMPSGMEHMAHRQHGMVGCLLVMASLVMLGSFQMMPRDFRGVFSCLPVVVCCFLGH